MESLPTQATEPGSAKGVPEAAGGRPTETVDTRPIKPFTVAEIVFKIRELIENQFPAAVWVEGELSNCSYPSSGHIYFSLVDEKATDRFPGPPGTKAGAGGQKLVLPCAFFRGANQGLKFKLTDGLKVLCLGQVTTYEGRGQYQLRVLRVEPKGIGALQLAFEQLKKKLKAEGLFDEARKRPIPAMPRRVGVITSLTGSAVHDMVSKLRDWFAVVVIPAKVQGEAAAQEIAESIQLANRLNLADVLIVGRGGGSVEDLWAFNEEGVARAIHRSRIPVISAVGHQDDWTIADYVADWRSSTPTDAAKLLVYGQETFAAKARDLIGSMLDGMHAVLEEQSNNLDGLSGRLRLLHPVSQLNRCFDRTWQLQQHLVDDIRHRMDGYSRHLEGVIGRLDALSPLAVLSRGYSITLQLPQRRVMTDARKLCPGDWLETMLAKGCVKSRVTDVVTEQTAGE